MSCIGEWTKDVEQRVEEVFALGKITAERGAARFKSEDDMWTFIVANRGKLRYEAEGKDIYANPDAMCDSDPGKTKAVREVVRMIIEKQGG